MKTVTLTIANQKFSKLIKEVENGETFVITRRGRPIAKLLPHELEKEKDPDWVAAYDRMVKLMDEGLPLGGLRVKREDLYDR